MRLQPVGLDLQETWLAVHPHRGRQIADGFVELAPFPGAADRRFDAEGRCTIADAAGQRFTLRCRLRILVVFKDDQHRQGPFGRDVEGLIHGALTQRAVTDEDDADVSLPLDLVTHGEAGGDGHDAPLDAVREEAVLAQVLTTAESAGDAGTAAHEFRDQTFDIVVPRNEMAMAPMIRKDRIALSQELRDDRSRHLLTYACMNSSMQFSSRKEIKESLLDQTGCHSLSKYGSARDIIYRVGQIILPDRILKNSHKSMSLSTSSIINHITLRNSLQ